jgi:hypothetical protein
VKAGLESESSQSLPLHRNLNPLEARRRDERDWIVRLEEIALTDPPRLAIDVERDRFLGAKPRVQDAGAEVSGEESVRKTPAAQAARRFAVISEGRSSRAQTVDVPNMLVTALFRSAYS